ncbi:hypothetical protein ACROYT_G024372 [Oculina patagonica]
MEIWIYQRYAIQFIFHIRRKLLYENPTKKRLCIKGDFFVYTKNKNGTGELMKQPDCEVNCDGLHSDQREKA